MVVRALPYHRLWAALLLVLPVFFANPAQAGMEHTPRPDGSSILWSVDLPETGKPRGLLVVAQGSGCLSIAKSHNLETVKKSFADFAALTVEKYGIDPNQEIADPFEDCPTAYHEYNTVSQRVADYAQIIDVLKDRPWWNGTLVLFGGSMGGTVMARLATRVEADAVILLSTGGGITFGDMIIRTIPEEAHPQIEQKYDEIRQNPDSTELWAGYSYRFWADSLDRREVDDMLETAAPILLINGGRDSSSPVGTARAAVDLFGQKGRCNLTYWELPGLDHGMADASDVSHLTDVLDQAAAWLDLTLSQPSGLDCAQPNYTLPD